MKPAPEKRRSAFRTVKLTPQERTLAVLDLIVNTVTLGGAHGRRTDIPGIVTRMGASYGIKREEVESMLALPLREIISRTGVPYGERKGRKPCGSSH